MTTPRRPPILDALRANAAEGRARSKAAKDAEYEFNYNAACIMKDLTYLVTKDGTVIDLTYFAPAIAWHLTRCGYRPVIEKRIIKARKITAPGVVDDAQEWVPIDAPDDPLKDLADMTMGQINKLAPIQRAEALRRMGGPITPDLPPNPGWHVATTMKIEDAPDPDDGYQWNQRRYGGKK
jgi:Protein of unknown function (DUF2744)